MHYLDRFGIAVLKVLSKFELRRLCRVVNATPLARVGAPTPEEMGFVDVFETIEIGGDRVTVLRQLVVGDAGFDPASKGEKTRTATIVLRGATANHLDDLERAIDDGVNVIKGLIKDARLVPGAGAAELELAKRVEAYGSTLKGLAQHAVKKFATALEVIPRTLAENATVAEAYGPNHIVVDHLKVFDIVVQNGDAGKHPLCVASRLTPCLADPVLSLPCTERRAAICTGTRCRSWAARRTTRPTTRR